MYSSTVGNGVFINVDVESDLKGQTRVASKCAAKNFMPNCDTYKLTHYRDCLITSEETRTTNPACNLRGTGWNRWEWLCQNPQDKALVPFDYLINNRLVVRDNHRPCIPTPLDQSDSLPPLGPQEVSQQFSATCPPPQEAPSVHWRKCGEIKKY